MKRKKFKIVWWQLVISIVLLIIVGSLLFLIIWKQIYSSKEQVAVLMYHQVLPKELIEEHFTDVITTDDFEQQLKYLKEQKYEAISLDQLACWRKKKCHIPKKSVVLTFDDGFSSVYYFARPLLEKYGYQATLFLVGSVVPKETKSYRKGQYNLIGRDMVKKPDAMLTYGSHSYDMHQLKKKRPKIFEMSASEMAMDIEKNREIVNVDYLAYPYNTDTKIMRKVLKEASMKLAFRGENEKATQEGSDYQIPRIGVNSNFDHFKSIFESNRFSNKYGHGLIRKVMVAINRKFHIKI